MDEDSPKHLEHGKGGMGEMGLSRASRESRGLMKCKQDGLHNVERTVGVSYDAEGKMLQR